VGNVEEPDDRRLTRSMIEHFTTPTEMSLGYQKKLGLSRGWMAELFIAGYVNFFKIHPKVYVLWECPSK